MKFDFDKVVDRHGTKCLKYDFAKERGRSDDMLPLWVADMDFRLPDEILDEFHKRIDHGIFGYTDPLDEYFAAMNHWFSTRYGYTIEPDWVTRNKRKSIYRKGRCHDGYAAGILSVQRSHQE